MPDVQRVVPGLSDAHGSGSAGFASARLLGGDLNSLPDLVLLVDIDTGFILDVNEHGAARLGWAISQLIGRKIGDLGHLGDDDIYPVLIEKLLAGEAVHFDQGVLSADGSRHPYNFSGRCPDGDFESALLIGREMGALAHSDSKLANLLMLADLTDDVFIVCDREGYITYANAACRRVHDVVVPTGKHMTEFLAANDEGYQELLKAYDRPDGRAEARVGCIGADGSTFYLGVRTVYDRATKLWYTVERDITTELEKERELTEMATTDALTGVANRYALNSRLEGAIAEGAPFAVLMLDMDDFKSVNDTLGHAAGDEFLCCVAKRLKHVLKPGDLVSRIGGDEFVVFLDRANAMGAAKVAERMIAAVSRPYSIGEHSVVRSCSVGGTVYRAGETVDELLRKADRAVYGAKHAGRNRYVIDRGGEDPSR